MKDTYCEKCGKKFVATNMGYYSKKTGKPIIERHCPDYFDVSFLTMLYGWQLGHE